MELARKTNAASENDTRHCQHWGELSDDRGFGANKNHWFVEEAPGSNQDQHGSTVLFQFSGEGNSQQGIPACIPLKGGDASPTGRDRLAVIS